MKRNQLDMKRNGTTLFNSYEMIQLFREGQECMFTVDHRHWEIKYLLVLELQKVLELHDVVIGNT